MEITEVRIRMSEGTGRLLATASITLNDVLVVRDMRVVNGPAGLFVAFPSKVLKKDDSGKDIFLDLVFPLTKNLRKLVQDTVLEEYEKELNT